MKQFVALARVSSPRQKREGFSLEEQESVLRGHSQREGGEIVKLFKIAETATKSGQRAVFNEMLDFVRHNARKLSGLLFVKIDRSARNMKDWVELEGIEERYDIPLVFVSQPSSREPRSAAYRNCSAATSTARTK